MSPLVFRATALLFIYLFAHRSRFPHSHLPPVSPNDSSASSSLGANMTVHLHEGQHVVSPSSEVRSLCNQSINPALWLYIFECFLVHGWSKWFILDCAIQRPGSSGCKGEFSYARRAFLTIPAHSTLRVRL